MAEQSLLFNPKQLHIHNCAGPDNERRYTLTHSDTSGDLFLTIAAEFDLQQISGWYTRFMRDEVLGEWLFEGRQPSLHIHCHVSGGVIFGMAGYRYAIFKGHLPLVLQVIRSGDKNFLIENPNLLDAPVIVHFHSRSQAYNKMENYGMARDYLVNLT
jgi:magnesium dechelatase